MRYILICVFLFMTSGLHAQVEKYYGKFFTDGSRKKNEFALTYDDGPGAATGDLLKLLDKYQVKATFFLLGISVEKYPDIAAQTARAGHLIGSHTWAHKLYIKVARSPGYEKVLETELEKAAEIISRTAGKRPVFLRMPNGYDKEWVRKVAAAKGYILVNWTYGSDWTRLSEEKMTAEYVKHVRPGAILLMHDGGGAGREKSLRITEKVLLEARRKGLKAVTLDELLDIKTAAPGKAPGENIVK